jgi:Domain of unknown function (DUF4440)
MKQERSMSALVHYESLLATFNKTVHAFNSGDVKELERLLHPHAVLNRIHHRKDADSLWGRENVVKHLGDKLKADKTQFTPIAPISVGVRTGTVSGIGEWEDEQGAISERICYSFIFVQDCDTKQWSLLNMDAALANDE